MVEFDDGIFPTTSDEKEFITKEEINELEESQEEINLKKKTEEEMKIWCEQVLQDYLDWIHEKLN